MKTYTTHKLSDPEVRHAKPQDKLYRLRDGGGFIVTFSLQVQEFGVTTTVFTENKKLLLLVNIRILVYQMLVSAKTMQKSWYQPELSPQQKNNFKRNPFKKIIFKL